MKYFLLVFLWVWSWKHGWRHPEKVCEYLHDMQNTVEIASKVIYWTHKTLFKIVRPQKLRDNTAKDSRITRPHAPDKNLTALTRMIKKMNVACHTFNVVLLTGCKQSWLQRLLLYDSRNLGPVWNEFYTRRKLMTSISLRCLSASLNHIMYRYSVYWSSMSISNYSDLLNWFVGTYWPLRLSTSPLSKHWPSTTDLWRLLKRNPHGDANRIVELTSKLITGTIQEKATDSSQWAFSQAH